METTRNKMKFIPLHYGDKLTTVNPYGCIGVVTFWSPPEFIYRRLKAAGADLSPKTSKVVVLGWLRGRGFRYMLRNLLYNPQIEALVLFGKAMFGESDEYLKKFFNEGLEEVNTFLEYEESEYHRPPRPVRLKGTKLILDNLVIPEMFKRAPQLFRIKGLRKQAASEAARIIDGFQPSPCGADRIEVPIPTPKITTWPSNVREHTIIARKPTLAWQLLVYRAVRFGCDIKLEGKNRRELQNVKVVVEKPIFEPEEIRRLGFSPDEFRNYQIDILNPDKSEFDYNYGMRIRRYFGIDCLEKVIHNLTRLAHGLDSRRSYITLWDNAVDGIDKSSENDGASSVPCLVSLFFRLQDRKAHLTATFRAHNIADAWLENFYGLMAIQDYVVRGVNENWSKEGVNAGKLEGGSLTTFSHSISIDPDSYEEMKKIADNIALKGPRFDKDVSFEENDPHGFFQIGVEGDEIVVKHIFGSHELKKYKAKDPKELKKQLAVDMAISNIDHAIYIGMELERAYRNIRPGSKYEQE